MVVPVPPFLTGLRKNYSIDGCLDAIDKATFAAVLLHLKKYRGILQTDDRKSSLFKNYLRLLAIGLLKANQHQLCSHVRKLI
jgi:CRISPR/Cas system Type II protein with McrA/HNH and RuvC-like nuclease domain